MSQTNSFNGAQSALNIAAGTVVKASAGRVARVAVTTAGSAAGAVYDTTTTGAVAAGNLVATIPNTVGVITIDFPVFNGLVVVPGTGQVVSVTYT